MFRFSIKWPFITPFITKEERTPARFSEHPDVCELCSDFFFEHDAVVPIDIMYVGKAKNGISKLVKNPASPEIIHYKCLLDWFHRN